MDVKKIIGMPLKCLKNIRTILWPEKYSNAQIWEDIYAGDLKKIPWIKNPLPEDIFVDFYGKIPLPHRILDYGCGDCRIAHYFFSLGSNITCADASVKALDLCKDRSFAKDIIHTNTPKVFSKGIFNAIILWGVLHHIPPSSRMSFVRYLSFSLSKNGVMLIGGWSVNDIEFNGKARISSVTNTKTWPIDSQYQSIFTKNGLEVIEKKFFSFTEHYKEKERMFVVFCLKKIR